MINLEKILKEKNISQAEIARKVGMTPQSFNRMINSGDIKMSMLIKIAKALEIPINLLFVTEQPLSEVISTSGKGVPYYDIDVTATITRSFSDIKEEPEFYVDFKPFNDCTAFLPVYGDSMLPRYRSGEIIAIKKWNNLDVILWGEAYLVITNENANNLRTVKLLYPHTDVDKFILRSSNPSYAGDTVILKNDIIDLFIVKGKVTREQL